MPHIRWQVLTALLGVVLLGVLLVFLTFNRTTILVPEQGGTYVEAVVGTPRHINPILCQYNELDRDLASLVFSGLTRIDGKGELVPELAKSWELSEDGLVYTFHLRLDVLWQDKVPFTAEDVLFTIQAIQDPNYQGPLHLAALWQSVRVQKVDDYAVRFTLEEAFAPFLDYTTVGILPAHLLRNVPAARLSDNPFNIREPIGTGPFRVSKVTQDHILLEANPFFYGPRPYLERIEFKFHPDRKSLIGAYRRDEVKGLSWIPPQDVAEIAKEEELSLYSAPLSSYVLIFLNLKRPAFQERAVRQALLTAIDRQGMIDQALNGQGIVAHSPIPLTSWAHHQGLKGYEYDPEAARTLLEKAGWKDKDGDGVREKGSLKLEFALLTTDDPVQMRIAALVSKHLAEVGIRAIPQKASPARIAPDFLRPRQFDALLYEWWTLPPDPDPYPMWHSTQTADGGQNFASFSNPEADQIMEMARRTSDRIQRIKLYYRFQEIFAEEVPSLPLYYPVYGYAVDRLVKGIQLGPMTEPADRFRSLAQWYIKTKKVVMNQPRWLELLKFGRRRAL